MRVVLQRWGVRCGKPLVLQRGFQAGSANAGENSASSAAGHGSGPWPHEQAVTVRKQGGVLSKVIARELKCKSEMVSKFQSL